jgi:hypothetical protein
MTERHGRAVKVVPIDMNLRYIIPFKEPVEIINYLLSLRDRGVEAVTYGDDGEKFGMWPGTLKWVYEDGWLERFMDAMSSSEDIEVVTVGDIITGHKPRGLVYLPSASYQEMMEWSLFSEQGRLYGRMVHDAKNYSDWNLKRGFIRGGIWDNFFAKYPESNRMHKKMLKISGLAEDYDLNSDVKKHLFMAQCNCGYWHGLFGGVYLDILRAAIYENLLEAEVLIDEQRFNDKPYIVEKEDYDLDGNEEIVISGRAINCIISPDEGASVFGIDHKPARLCISDVMMRHPEIYHEKILESQDTACVQNAADKPLSIHDIPFATSDELRNLLIYDRYSKNSFITHILEDKPDLQVLLKGVGPDETPEALDVYTLENIHEEASKVRLKFKAQSKGIEIAKELIYDPKGEISVLHDAETEDQPMETMFIAIEMNVMLSGKPQIDMNEEAMEKTFVSGSRLVLKDDMKGAGIEILSEKPWDIVYLPIECASQSESGFEKTFQGWSIYFIRQLSGKIPELKLNFQVKNV